MSKIKLKRIETHTVVQVHYDEVDTTDQEAWEHLKSNCAEWFEDDLALVPEAAPEDPSDWLKLYSMLAEGMQSKSEPDSWVSISRGGYPVEFEVEDERGNVISRIT